jgi:multiple antibiotic resistance protein
MNLVLVIISSVISLFAILNPIGLIPVYEELLVDVSARERSRLFLVTTLTGLLTLLILTFTGRFIMDSVFHIGIDEFRIAGGIILTVLGVRRVVFLAHEHHEPHHGNLAELGAVPMAVPLLVGPGSIVTGILVLDREGWLVALLSIVISFMIVALILNVSSLIFKFIGRLGVLVVGRILYIFITAIGVRFLLVGLSNYFGLA